MRRVCDYLHEHAEKATTLDELAAVAGLSRFELVRQFHMSFGLPPHAYRTQLRINKAKRLLASGLPLVEIANALGFADQAHLTRVFKRTVGATPGRYQASRPQ
jgi:AraC-like DNA-binding protein